MIILQIGRRIEQESIFPHQMAAAVAAHFQQQVDERITDGRHRSDADDLPIAAALLDCEMQGPQRRVEVDIRFPKCVERRQLWIQQAAFVGADGSQLDLCPQRLA